MLTMDVDLVSRIFIPFILENIFQSKLHAAPRSLCESYGVILPTVSTLIQEDPRNNSAWNQRWFSIHRGTKIQLLPPDVARAEADYAITVATLDPYNESPWVYFVGILREQCRAGAGDDTNRVGMLKEYEGKVYAVRNVLSNVQREPDTCSNLTSARIDVLELIGDRTSLEEVRNIVTVD